MPRDPLEKIWEAINDLELGLFRSPNGPATILGQSIKPKAITAGLINVSSLESMNAKTGSLSVTGDITMTAAGSFSAGQSDYDTGVGWWLDMTGATPRFSLGNSGGSKIVWNGTTLAITGTITATGGTIGGWTITGDDLTAGSGTGSIGLSPSGSVRIWSGNATPSSAPFQVSSLGALTATSGSIGGWDIDSNQGLKLGTGASTRGISIGSVAFYAGSATPSSAPFNVTTAGALSASNISVTGGTITGGTITASLINAGTLTFNGGGTLNGGGATVAGTLGNSGGTLNLGKLTVAGQITLGSGGSIIDADGSFWDQTGITLRGTGSLGDSISFSRSGFSPTGGIQSAFATDLGQMRMSTTATASRAANLSLNATAVDSTTNATILVNKSGGGEGGSLVIDAAGTHSWYVDASTEGMHLSRTNRALTLSGYLYPGSGSGSQASRYFSDNGTRTVLTGGDLDINNMTAASPGNTAWASRGMAADGGGYVILYVNGTGYKIPTYA